jgi:probable rRNA maturation factor
MIVYAIEIDAMAIVRRMMIRFLQLSVLYDPMLLLPCSAFRSVARVQHRRQHQRVLGDQIFIARSIGFCQYHRKNYGWDQKRTKHRRRDRCHLFGSKVGSPNDGEIFIENQQSDLPDIDLDRIRTTISKIRHMIGYNTYDVSLFLVNDHDMKKTNYETRGVNQPTDILSFPFHEAVVAGTISQPEFDIPEYYQLGDIMVDVTYVIRRSLEDQAGYAPQLVDKVSSIDSLGDAAGKPMGEMDEDRGVSRAMKCADPESRINMLLVHGMLHLIGYDHESDEDYGIMIEAEERLLRYVFPNH